MIRLFLSALLPSLLAFITLPVLALSSADRPPLRLQDRRLQQALPTVVIEDASFDPDELPVKAGQTVNWANQSQRDHQIVIQIDERTQVKSGTIKPGKSWTRKFEKVGTYPFHCSLHPRAKGEIKVAPADPE